MGGGMVNTRGFFYTPLDSDKDAVGLRFFVTFPVLMLTTTLPNLITIGEFLGGLRSLQKKVIFYNMDFLRCIFKKFKTCLNHTQTF